MTNEEKILEMLTTMQSDIKGIKKAQEAHTEILETHTSALNELLDWAENAAIEIRIPFAETKKPQ